MASRALSQSERQTAFRVFQHTIPYDKIAICSGLGIGGRPFTVPNPWPWDWEKYDIYMGFQNTWQGKVSEYWATLIHELTHVWQGTNSWSPLGYIFNSLWHQLKSGSKAYEYKAGGSWSDYNVEQQASIVEDWFRRGCSSKDVLFPYIRDFVWRGIT